MCNPLVIMCYKRSEELEKVLASLSDLCSKIYFHVHDAPDKEQQKEVDNVLDVINNYKGEKEVMHVKEPLGCRRSFYSALKWISANEDRFFFWEDDVVFKGDAKEINSQLSKRNGIIKFGELQEHPVFWGWGLDKETAKKILDFNLLDQPKPKAMKYFSNEVHYKGIVHLLKKGAYNAWDDEVGIVIKCEEIPVKLLGVHTENIGINSSTRETNGINEHDTVLTSGNYVIFENGKIIN